MKGEYRRGLTTIHIPTGTLDVIDEYLEECNAQDGTKITWSDFVVEAHLKSWNWRRTPRPGG